MANHLVKCLYCHGIFDADKEEWVKPRVNRYAHKKCAELIEAGLDVEIVEDAAPPPPPVRTQHQIDYQNLKDYIWNLYNKQCNWQVVAQQLKKFELEGYTLSGIKKTLYYWYEIKKNPVSKANKHIGIVPYAYPLAEEYFKRLYEIEQKNKDKSNFQEDKKEKECIQVKIKEPEIEKKKIKFFNIGEE